MLCCIRRLVPPALALVIVATFGWLNVHGQQPPRENQRRRQRREADKAPPRGITLEPKNARGRPARGLDTTPPRVASVSPDSSTWPAGSLGLSEVHLSFDEPVVVPPGSVAAWTVGGGTILPGTGFTSSLDPTEMVLAVTFATPIRDDRLTILIDYTVTDLAGNELDGEVAFPEFGLLPSGDGQPGGQAVFRFNILQGDANRDGTVDATDGGLVSTALGLCTGDPGFDPQADLNRDGCVNVLDAGIFRLAEGRTLPATDGDAPTVVQISPNPAVGLFADLVALDLSFSEPIDTVGFNPRTAYLVDGTGTLHVPTSASLAPDGLSASFDFVPPLPRCEGYSVNLSNALTDLSGELFSRPVPSPLLSGFLSSPAPTLNPHTTMTASTLVTITGTVSGADAIEVSGPAAIFLVPVTAGEFTSDVPLGTDRVNQLFFTALSSCGGARSAPVTTSVTHDNESPNLFIDFPPDGTALTTVTTDVAGRVGDLLSGFMGLTVTVNGVPAIVDVGIGNNGTFFAADVPLAVGGPNVLEATATDELGNSTTKQIVVTQAVVPPDAPQMQVLSGNGQTGQVGAALPLPIVARVTHGDGTPFANKIVTFNVTRSNGRLTSVGVGDGSLTFQAKTDTNGEATAAWQLGSDAGCGNNRIEVTSKDIVGTTFFCASALPAPVAQINIGSGNNQKAEAGGSASEPLRVWVHDGNNGVANVPVTFTVVQGDGTVNGRESSIVPTSVTGHAEAALVLGLLEDSNRVEATFPGNTGLPATFSAQGITRLADQPTSFSGMVLDNSSRPIGGALATLTIGATTVGPVASDLVGRFRFDNLPTAGPAKLHVDGLPADRLSDAPIPQGSFPSLSYELVIVPNAENSLHTPVLLPPLDPANARVYDGTHDVELTVRGIEGLKLIVKAGSMTRADGSTPSPSDPAIISLNQVHFDEIPMPMPDGAAPPFASTLQPAGARFDPPVKIEMPNMVGLPPGTVMYFLSFNHDTNRFEIVASGSVTADGSSVVSDTGVGISVSGWHGARTPPPIITIVNNDPPRPACAPARDALVTAQLQTAAAQAWLLTTTALIPVETTVPVVGCGISIVTSTADCLRQSGASVAVETTFWGCLLGASPGVLLTCAADIAEASVIGAPFAIAIKIATTGATLFNKKQELDDLLAAESAAQTTANEACCPEQCIPSLLTTNGIAAMQVNELLIPHEADTADLALASAQSILTASAVIAASDPIVTNFELLAPDWNPLVDKIVAALNGTVVAVDGTAEAHILSLLDQEAILLATLPHYEAIDLLLPQLGSDLDAMLAAAEAAAESLDAVVRASTFADMFVVLSNQSAPVLADGSFTLRNIPATQGLVRARLVRRGAAVETIGASAFVQLVAGTTTFVGLFELGAFPLPVSLNATSNKPTLTSLGGLAQITVAAQLADGSSADVTPRVDGTTYTSTNPVIATVDQNGLVTATGAGIAFITATNQGATTVARIIVSPGDPLTTVEGFVQLADGTPVAGAAVKIFGLGGSGISGPDGRFVVAGLASEFGAVNVLVDRPGTTTLFGSSLGIIPVGGGLSDAGIITMQSICEFLGAGCLDTDGDCVPDSLEAAMGLDPNNPDSDSNGTLDGAEDFDGDTLSTCAELFLGGNPNDPDDDFDRDGLTVSEELLLKTDPFDHDTDNDTWPDGGEVEFNSDPLDPLSRPKLFVVTGPPAFSVLPGPGDPKGLTRNTTVTQPPVSLVLPGTGDFAGLLFNTSVAQPPVSLVLPGSGDAKGLLPNTTVARPPASVLLDPPP